MPRPFQGILQGQHQGQLSQLPLQAKICIAVTDTEYAYLTLCKRIDANLRFCSPQHSLHREAIYSPAIHI